MSEPGTTHTGPLFDRAEEAASVIRERIEQIPTTAVVLGSGLGPLAERLRDRVVVPYRSLPHFPAATVAGHEGNLVAGTVEGTPVLYLQGRFHYYEGHDLDSVTFPTRVLSRLGVKRLILTAATGGINREFHPGDLVCLTDHLNLLGVNPLRGPNDDRFGPRFPDMTCVYSPELRKLADIEAARLGIALKTGVYAVLPGPSYETPAEIQMLRLLGADVVGMSTVPEAIVARHAGMDVLAFALVTNAAAGVTGEAINHEEVLEAGRQAVPRLGRLIEAVVRGFADSSSKT
ncbi:MAG: purine-nucleoside phosphorylase [Isosphaeraceae bacterium]